MAFVFWNAKDIVFINYFQKGRTINREYYASLLKQLRKAIKAERPGKLTKVEPFHQYNAPPNKLVVAMAAVHDCRFTLLDHSPYLSGAIRLISAFEYEKTPSWEALPITRGSDSCCGGVVEDQDDGSELFSPPSYLADKFKILKLSKGINS